MNMGYLPIYIVKLCHCFINQTLSQLIDIETRLTHNNSLINIKHYILVENGRFWHVGQNLYTAWNSRKSVSADWQSGVQAWYDEVNDFDTSHVSKYQ